MSINKVRRCECCGEPTLAEGETGSYEICSVCNWEDDPVQSANPTMRGGANVYSLEEARQLFAERAPSVGRRQEDE